MNSEDRRQDDAWARLVGQLIAVARRSRQLSQKELGQAIGRSQNYIYTIETGSIDPGLIALYRIAEILEIEFALFLSPLVPPATLDPGSQRILEMAEQVRREAEFRGS